MGPNFISPEPLKNTASVLQKVKQNCTKESLHMTYSKPLKTMEPTGLKDKDSWCKKMSISINCIAKTRIQMVPHFTALESVTNVACVGQTINKIGQRKSPYSI